MSRPKPKTRRLEIPTWLHAVAETYAKARGQTFDELCSLLLRRQLPKS